MILRTSILFILLVLMAACSSDDGITVTPPVVTAVSPPSSTSTTEQPVETAVSEPSPTLPIEPPPVTAVSAITLAPIITEGLDRPLYLTHAGDDRLFVLEKAGTVRIVENGVLLPEPFLDIRDRVDGQASERGLLSVAFHPDYAVDGAVGNGRFFVNYTDDQGSTVISRFQVSADANRAAADSEVNLLTIPQPFSNHNGGQIQFGPDGYLYVGMGDGGAAGDPQKNGQNAQTLLGAMLRLDVDAASAEANYGVPASNPFVNGGGRGEIWAIGVRNPWRFSFDRLTGDLFIADVGQNVWEEVSLQPTSSPGGENYGWDILEASQCFGQQTCDSGGTILPIHEYAHENGRCSITGGYVYRGQKFPALSGNYFFGDYCTGEIWSLAPAEGGVWSAQLVLDTPGNVASFGEDANGELYVVDLQGGVYRIQE
ncbi:MAG: PQQ-dependent sugar dehydrogenase [Chloroflexota bacterium]